MEIGEAMRRVMAGERLQRAAWQNTRITNWAYIRVHPNDPNPLMYFTSGMGGLIRWRWSPHVADLLATDWQVRPFGHARMENDR